MRNRREALKGSCHAICTRVVSTKKMSAPSPIQNGRGTCWKWLMAGPVTWASKRKEEPSTCSPTMKPTEASIARRPWVISTSAYLCASAWSMLLKKPKRSMPSSKGALPWRRPASTAAPMFAYVWPARGTAAATPPFLPPNARAETSRLAVAGRTMEGTVRAQMVVMMREVKVLRVR